MSFGIYVDVSGQLDVFARARHSCRRCNSCRNAYQELVGGPEWTEDGGHDELMRACVSADGRNEAIG